MVRCGHFGVPGAGWGGGHAALIIFATPRGRWSWIPKAAGWIGEGLRCLASPPLRHKTEKIQARGLVNSITDGERGTRGHEGSRDSDSSLQG